MRNSEGSSHLCLPQHLPQCTKARTSRLKQLVWELLTSFLLQDVWLRQSLLQTRRSLAARSHDRQGSKLSEGKPPPRLSLSQLQAPLESSTLCSRLLTCRSMNSLTKRRAGRRAFTSSCGSYVLATSGRWEKSHLPMFLQRTMGNASALGWSPVPGTSV